MARKYGCPYVGSKNNIAEKVIDFLPPGKRLCDLFGGGGAITHCAVTYGKDKWDSVLYNDFDPIVVEYVRNAFGGKYDIDENEPEIISREDFNELKKDRGDVAFLWSFGNNAIDYLWSKDKEEVKLSAFAMLTRKTVDERYRYYKRFVKALKNFLDAMSQNDRFWSVEPIERIQSIERIQRIEEIHAIENIMSAGRVQPTTNIQFTNMSYSEYERMDGDVVYCDIPYEKSKAKTPYNKFDHKAFYDWANSRTYPVYISSYEISDERFKGVVLSKRRQLLGKGKTDEMRDEMIYMNEAAVKEQETIINEEAVQMSLFGGYK